MRPPVLFRLTLAIILHTPGPFDLSLSSTTLPMPKALTLAILLHTPGIPRSTHLITFRIS